LFIVRVTRTFCKSEQNGTAWKWGTGDGGERDPGNKNSANGLEAV